MRPEVVDIWRRGPDNHGMGSQRPGAEESDPLPAVHARGATAGSVPVWLTRFVGRHAELETAGELLACTRLLTLTGAGGSGKTRLAAALATMRSERSGDEICWVELAAVSDPGQVIEQVTMAAGLATRPGTDAAWLLAAQLADRPMLLCLDNCEHVLTAVADLARTVLQSCPGVCVLATSREPLHLAGETVWTVPTLSPGDAAALFAERARQACPRFGADPADMPAVGLVCARLDGLPLALELAAAWLRTLTAAELAAELDHRFALLVRGPRAVVARHETLLASMNWSHDMLSGAEQAVFRRLAVFAGSFTLDAARAVCALRGTGEEGVLDAVSRLVDKSLLVTGSDGGRMRYRQLETVRAYAHDRLAEAGETTAARDRHLDYFLGLVESAAAQLDGDADRWRTRLEAEHDNLREALDWGLAADDPERGRRLAAGLPWLWQLHGHGREGFAYLQRAIDRDPSARSLLQARLLAGVAVVADTADPLDREADAAGRAAELAAEHDDQRLEALCLQLTAIGELYTDFDAAWQLNLKADQLARDAGEHLVSDGARTLQGVILHLRDRHDQAEPLLQGAVEGLLERGNRHVAATTLAFQASGEASTGRLSAALRTARRAVELAEPLGDYHRVGTTRSMLAIIQGLSGDLEAAAATLSPVLGVTENSAEELFVPWLALAAGRLYLWQGDSQRALPWLRRESQSTDRGRGTYFAAQALPVLGAALRQRGERDAAARALDDAERLARRLGMPRALADALEQQAHLAQPDDPDRALELHHAALAIRTGHGLRTFYADSLDSLGALALTTSRPDRAARLIAASDRERESIGYPRPPNDRAAHLRLLADARDTLGPASFAAHWNAGEGLAIDTALAYARRSRGPRERPSTGWASLTPTEREVVEMAASGATNPEIAIRLLMSRGTVKTHLSHAYAKLGVSNRTELAAHHPHAKRSLPSRILGCQTEHQQTDGAGAEP